MSRLGSANGYRLAEVGKMCVNLFILKKFTKVKCVFFSILEIWCVVGWFVFFFHIPSCWKFGTVNDESQRCHGGSPHVNCKQRMGCFRSLPRGNLRHHTQGACPKNAWIFAPRTFFPEGKEGQSAWVDFCGVIFASTNHGLLRAVDLCKCWTFILESPRTYSSKSSLFNVGFGTSCYRLLPEISVILRWKQPHPPSSSKLSTWKKEVHPKEIFDDKQNRRKKIRSEVVPPKKRLQLRGWERFFRKLISRVFRIK